MRDAREVEGENHRDIREDRGAKIGVRQEEGVVKLVTKRVIAGAERRKGERGGDNRVCNERGNDGLDRMVGVSERKKNVGGFIEEKYFDLFFCRF